MIAALYELWREFRYLPQPEYNRLRQPAVDQLKQARANLKRHMAECTEEKSPPRQPAWKYAGISLNPEHFETFAPEETHERRGLDGHADNGADSSLGGEHHMAGAVPIEELIERSSLGTPEAKAMRERCAPRAVDAVLKRLAELDADRTRK